MKLLHSIPPEDRSRGLPFQLLSSFSLFLSACDLAFVDKTLLIGWVYQKEHFQLFSTWIIFLSKELTLLFPWPSRKQIDSLMPRSFCQKYPSTRIILDCMEVQVQRPTHLLGQSQTFSHYKSRNTFKLLVGVSPSRLITFLSPLWGG